MYEMNGLGISLSVIVALARIQMILILYSARLFKLIIAAIALQGMPARTVWRRVLIFVCAGMLFCGADERWFILVEEYDGCFTDWVGGT
jgi:hypothetical protein